MKNYLCLCSHWSDQHEDGKECRRCVCEIFEPDDDAMKDLSDSAKILNHDVETEK